jgi:hypothetical protein
VSATELRVLDDFALACQIAGNTARLLCVDIPDAPGPAPTRELLRAARISRFACFGRTVVSIADDHLCRIDVDDGTLARTPVRVRAGLLDIHAWLSEQVAIASFDDGSVRLVPLNGAPDAPIPLGYFGRGLDGLEPRAELIGTRLVWAHAAQLLTRVELEQLRPQIVGALRDRARFAPTRPARLWVSTDGRRAATLAVDGRLERFDLDAARPIDHGWLTGAVLAASPTLERFACDDGEGPRWIDMLPHASTVSLRTGAAVDDQHVLTIDEDGTATLVRVADPG